MADQPPTLRVSGVDGRRPARGRGRPPIVVTEEVLEQRRLSRQRIRANGLGGADVPGPARRRGRPPIVVTEEVLKRRRLSRQRVNAQRPRGENSTRRRGRPSGSVNKSNLDQQSLAASPLVGTVDPAEGVPHDRGNGVRHRVLMRTPTYSPRLQTQRNVLENQRECAAP